MHRFLMFLIRRAAAARKVKIAGADSGQLTVLSTSGPGTLAPACVRQVPVAQGSLLACSR